MEGKEYEKCNRCSIPFKIVVCTLPTYILNPRCQVQYSILQLPGLTVLLLEQLRVASRLCTAVHTFLAVVYAATAVAVNVRSRSLDEVFGRWLEAVGTVSRSMIM